MAANKYKLTYFDGRGRAEIIRLVFTAAGTKFDDVRISRDELASMKPTLPYGQVPILEFDGHTMCQSLAIARYLANEFGLAGKNSLEKLRADMIVDCISDARNPIVAFFRMEPDPVKKEELRQKYAKEELPAYLDKLEALLVQNKGGNGYFVGDNLTWADLGLVVFSGALELMASVQAPYAKHPKLEALFKRVVGLPKIAEYISKRPVTSF